MPLVDSSAHTDAARPRHCRPRPVPSFLHDDRHDPRTRLDNLTCPFEARNTNPAMPAVRHAMARTRRHAHDATDPDRPPLSRGLCDERNDAVSSPLPSPMLLPLCSIVIIVALPVPLCSLVPL